MFQCLRRILIYYQRNNVYLLYFFQNKKFWENKYTKKLNIMKKNIQAYFNESSIMNFVW